MGVDSYQKLVERGVVEVAPLAYMRGRTLSDSFIILDEAQNTTSEQMKMFLTRLGFNSKVVVTGDVTQTDLPFGKRSGLAEDKVEKLLDMIPETCSLDAPAGEEDTALRALLEDVHAPQPQEQRIREELNHTMEQLLGMLSERQQQVLRLHFGMDDGVCHSLEEISGMLGVSKERARQIERQAMDKLKKRGASMRLEDFLE